jgi:hypothetical protein
MTERDGELSGFEELGEFLVKVVRGLEREHWPLTAGDQDGVELRDVDLGDLPRVLDQCSVLR